MIDETKKMSTGEIAKVLNVTNQTIRNAIRILHPNLLNNGKKTFLNELQVTEVKNYLSNHHNLKSTFEVKTLKTNLELNNQAEFIRLILEPILKQQNDFNQNLINEIKTLKNSDPKQIEFKETIDYFTIIGYARKNKTSLSSSEIQRLSRIAMTASKEMGYDFQQIEDTNFGFKNIYHKDILKIIFENREKEIKSLFDF